MPSLFSAKELIEVAVREEQTGAVYYRALADATMASVRDIVGFVR